MASSLRTVGREEGGSPIGYILTPTRSIPSEADAEAAQFTDGVDMILGVWFSPEVLRHGMRMLKGQGGPN